MISENQKEVQQQIIGLKRELDKYPLYAIFANKLDGLIKRMDKEEFSQDKLNEVKSLFGSLSTMFNVSK
jgi:hypothetical protein